MEAQQIRLHINELVNGIEDEAFLKACHEAVEGIAKAYRRVAGKSNGAKSPAKTTRKTDAPAVPASGESGMEANAEAEKPLPHDLSLVFLANEVFKGSEPLPEEGEIAFEWAFKKSLKTQPALPNRF
ncbi:MAG: hypothetical protein EPO28_01785 [Saprospiraceae bacterium]|nr:MAG: hypothetical protein EPO28_01785 [Saprospiraceae bacterium]